MTALAVREEITADLDVRHPEPPRMMPSRLTQWAYDAKQANQVARSLAITAFVPQSLRGRHQDPDVANQITISQITAAILAGQEVGLDPMAALRSIDIIEGTPGMRAQALRGVVQSHGHDIWVEESTSTRAIVCGQRRGSEKIQKSVWTIDRAKQMGLTGKQNWIKQPTAMLVARATSEVCRWVGGDAILGMPYSSEELSDGIDTPEENPTPETAATPAKRTAKRKPVAPPPPVAEPQIDQPTVDTPIVDTAADINDAVPVSAVPVSPAAPTGDGAITKERQDSLKAAFDYAGFVDKAEMLARARSVVGRQIGSATELTQAEADLVIADLTALPDDIKPASAQGGAE